jgi:hypothetical protein
MKILDELAAAIFRQEKLSCLPKILVAYSTKMMVPLYEATWHVNLALATM